MAFWRLMFTAINPTPNSWLCWEDFYLSYSTWLITGFQKNKHLSPQNAAHLHSVELLRTKTMPNSKLLVSVNNWPSWLLLENLLKVLLEWKKLLTLNYAVGHLKGKTYLAINPVALASRSSGAFSESSGNPWNRMTIGQNACSDLHVLAALAQHVRV